MTTLPDVHPVAARYDQARGGIDPRRHLGELELDRLELADRLAELGRARWNSERRLVGAARQAQPARRWRCGRRRGSAWRPEPCRALRAEESGGTRQSSMTSVRCRTRACRACSPSCRAGSPAPALEDEGRDLAARASGSVTASTTATSPTEAVGRERLRAVQDPASSIRGPAWSRPARVVIRRGLGQAPGADPLARGELGRLDAGAALSALPNV